MLTGTLTTYLLNSVILSSKLHGKNSSPDWMFHLAAKEFSLFLLQSAKVSMMCEMVGQEFLQGNRTFQSHAEQATN